MSDPSQDPPASAESFFRREEGSTRPTEVAAGAVKGAYAPGRTIGEYQLVRRLGRGKVKGKTVKVRALTD